MGMELLKKSQFLSIMGRMVLFLRRKEIMTLDDLKPGSECLIKKLNAQDKLGQRLMDMGMYPGLRLKVIRNAPLEDPMEVDLEGYHVSLRHEEAKFVEVEPQ